MTKIIDKRFLPKNQASKSRQKFIDRYKSVIKDKVRDLIVKGNMKDILKGDKKIKINNDDLSEPSFELDQDTGNKDRVYVGNKKFKKGDEARRPRSSQGKGGAGNGGQGDDEFEFLLTEKEFADLFFEDLELPDMVKKEFTTNSFEVQHAGISRTGGPSSLNIKRTMINAIGRQKVLKSKQKGIDSETIPDWMYYAKRSPTYIGKKVPLIDELDLRYNFKDKQEVPVSKCAMICLMDVSGSMSEREKDIAKRFFLLLNLFLKRNYNEVDVIFVRHSEIAEEVDEDKFYHDRQSGGTIVSSGYEKIKEIINQRYNSNQTNIYIAQASDGDNYEADKAHMEDVLVKYLLPVVQYFAYIDIRNIYFQNSNTPSDVFHTIRELMAKHKNLQGREVKTLADIWPVFRSLFKKKDK